MVMCESHIPFIKCGLSLPAQCNVSCYVREGVRIEEFYDAFTLMVWNREVKFHLKSDLLFQGRIHFRARLA